MSYTIPSDAHGSGDSGHVPDHNNLSDMAALLTAISLQLYQHTPALPTGDTNNPANVTALSALLGSTVTALLSTQLGAANGAASLDGTGLVPTTQLPIIAQSLVLAGSGAPSGSTGLDGDTYIDTATGKRYGRASGSWSINGQVGWSLLATTGPSGTAVNPATGGTYLTWTAPSDGNWHRIILAGQMIVGTTWATANAINLVWTDPTSTSRTAAAFGAAQTAGATPTAVNNQANTAIVGSGQTISLTQTAAGTGAATLYLEMWGS